MHALHEEDHMHEKHGHDLSRDDLIREAKMQTDAIQRLNVWLRLGYSLVAIGFLMGMWGMQGGPGWGVPVGIVCLVVGTPLSIVLKVGTTNAKKMSSACSRPRVSTLRSLCDARRTSNRLPRWGIINNCCEC